MGGIRKYIPDWVFQQARKITNRKVLSEQRKQNAQLKSEFFEHENTYGLNLELREKEIVVSFTTYPARIRAAVYVADRMLRQTMKPDKVILYLSKEEFTTDNLPDEFEILEKRGLSIEYREENLKSHKKWYYAMREYKDAIIITVDDDIIFPLDLIETLWKTHLKNPKAVCAMRAHKMELEKPYAQWKKDINERGKSSEEYMATGVGGCLYPPTALDEKAFAPEIFMKLAPTADDIWLKAMEMLKNTPVALTDKSLTIYEIGDSQKTALVYDNIGRGKNDEQLKAVFETYKLIKKG